MARSSSKRLNQGPFILFTSSATPITSERRLEKRKRSERGDDELGTARERRSMMSDGGSGMRQTRQTESERSAPINLSGDPTRHSGI